MNEKAGRTSRILANLSEKHPPEDSQSVAEPADSSVQEREGRPMNDTNTSSGATGEHTDDDGNVLSQQIRALRSEYLELREMLSSRNDEPLPSYTADHGT